MQLQNAKARKSSMNRLGSKKNLHDTLLGKKGRVSVEVNNFAGRGQLRLMGEFWSCRALYDEDLYRVGEKLVVVAVEGVKLVCKKA